MLPNEYSNCTSKFSLSFFILSSSGFHHLNINTVINDENLKHKDELETGKVCIILVYIAVTVHVIYSYWCLFVKHLLHLKGHICFLAVLMLLRQIQVSGLLWTGRNKRRSKIICPKLSRHIIQ